MSCVKRFASWAVAVPLMLGGTEVSHALAYHLVYPEAQVRLQVLAATGHGYLGWAPLVLGVGFAVAIAGLLSVAVDTARRRPTTPVAPWVFALLPLASFTMQELLERWLISSSMPWWMFEQPTFRVGLALQLPFAALAFLVTRVLLRAARTVGVAIAGNPARIALTAEAPRACPRSFAAFSLRVPALGWGVRGPPIPA